jgi:predicted outer membrane repeat protein
LAPQKQCGSGLNSGVIDGGRADTQTFNRTHLMKTTLRNHSPRGQHKSSFIEPLESRIAPATIIVTSLLDATVSGKTDLRQALAQADTDLAMHPGVVNTIKFEVPPAAAHTENIITLDGAVLTSNGDVNIVGPGAGKLIINGNDASGVFQFGGSAGLSTISGLSIVNGSRGNGGGGIYCSESLTLKNVVISGNTSNAFGAGVNIHGNDTTPPKISIISSQITGNQTAGSSAIDLYETGSINITKTVISGNANGLVGGLVSAGVAGTISDSLISGNAGTGINLYTDSTTSKITISGTKITGNTGGGVNIGACNEVITGSTIENNTASYVGGGVYSSGPTSLTISKSSIIGNRTTNTSAAEQGGGGLFINGSGSGTPAPVRIVASNISDNSSALDGGGLFAKDGIALSIAGSTFTGNRAASGVGGAIATRGTTATGVVNLTVTGSLFSDNVADRGGAIAAQGATALEGNGTFSITASIVTENVSLGADGGINVATSAAVTVKNTAVTDNFAAAFGGGLDIIDTTNAMITGGLIAGNSATGVGGGLRLFGVTGTIMDATITGNAAGTSGGGIYENSSAVTIATSSKVFANTAANDPDFDGSGFTF